MKLTFEMALVHLKQGKMVRRYYWPEEVCIVKGRRENADYDDIIEIWTDEDGIPREFDCPSDEPWFCSSDIFEDDWEVVE